MDEKLWRENGKENFFEVCLVWWGRRKINNEARVFSPQGHQKVFPPQWRENWSEKIGLLDGQKCPCALAHMQFVQFVFFLTRYAFIFWTWFLFFRKLGDCFFFFFLAICHFFVLISNHFFNKDVWVNLYKLTFFIPPFFHSQLNKNERN